MFELVPFTAESRTIGTQSVSVGKGEVMAKKARRKTAAERESLNRISGLEVVISMRNALVGDLENQLKAAKRNLSVCADNVARLERVVADQDERTKYDARVLAGRNDTINKFAEEVSQISTLQRFWKEQYEIADKGRSAAESAAFLLAIPVMLNWSVSRIISFMKAVSKFANIIITDEILLAMSVALTKASPVTIRNEINFAKSKTEEKQEASNPLG
jgi:hypothetical protein